MMRRTFFSISLMIILASLALTACGPSPKARAKQYADRMPDEIGEFDKEDRRVELSAEAIDSIGHVTVWYSHRSLGEVYVVIDAYGTKSAADVAIARRERDWRLLGYEFDTDRKARLLTATVADLPQGRIGILQDNEVLIEIQYIRNGDEELDEASWDAFLATVRRVDQAIRGRDVSGE